MSCILFQYGHTGFWLQDENEQGDKEGTEEQDDTRAPGKKSSAHPVLLEYKDAPSYLKFNPYIRSGYRGYLSTKMCLER
jgi:hypothetical protein